jgi:hypothetical protein
MNDSRRSKPLFVQPDLSGPAVELTDVTVQVLCLLNVAPWDVLTGPVLGG